MATQLQLRKGTRVENDAFTGAEGEVTYESNRKLLRLHDGSTQGGFLIDPIVEFQEPTGANNYTWYRKYASGWVEQGGKVSGATSASAINFPVTMADSNYYINGHVFGNTDTNSNWIKFGTLTTTGTTYVTGYGANNMWAVPSTWEVKGMAA